MVSCRQVMRISVCATRRAALVVMHLRHPVPLAPTVSQGILKPVPPETAMTQTILQQQTKLVNVRKDGVLITINAALANAADGANAIGAGI